MLKDQENYILGIFLHQLSNNLISFHHTINSTIKYLDIGLIDSKRVLNINEILAFISNQKTSLLEKLFQMTKDDEKTISKLNVSQNNIIRGILEVNSIPEYFQLYFLSERLPYLLNVMEGLINDNNYEKIMEIQEIAKDILRIIVVWELKERSRDLIEIDSQITNFRSFHSRGYFERDTINSKVSIGEVVKQVILELIEFAKMSGISIKYIDETKFDIIYVNHWDIEQAIKIIITNAIKYSFIRKNNFVNVKLSESEKDVILEVEDYGVFITKEEIDDELIFLFGYRSRNVNDRRGFGAGIGLYIAKQTILKYNGRISVESNLLSDDDLSRLALTKFRIEIPKKNPAIEEI